MRRRQRRPSSIFRLGALGIALGLLQNLVFRDLTIFGVHPDAMLLLVVCVGIAMGSDRGALVGFGAGLLTDVFLPSALGLSALAYTLAGFAAGALADDASELPWIVSLLAIITTVGGIAVLGVTGWITGDIHASVGRMLWIALILAITNALCAPWLTALMRRMASPALRYSP